MSATSKFKKYRYVSQVKKKAIEAGLENEDRNTQLNIEFGVAHPQFQRCGKTKKKLGSIESMHDESTNHEDWDN